MSKKKQIEIRVTEKHIDTWNDELEVTTALLSNRIYLSAIVGEAGTCICLTPEQALAIRKQITRFLRATGHLPTKGE